MSASGLAVWDSAVVSDPHVPPLLHSPGAALRSQPSGLAVKRQHRNVHPAIPAAVGKQQHGRGGPAGVAFGPVTLVRDQRCRQGKSDREDDRDRIAQTGYAHRQAGLKASVGLAEEHEAQKPVQGQGQEHQRHERGEIGRGGEREGRRGAEGGEQNRDRPDRVAPTT